MRGLGFANQGSESSRDCAFHVCTLCSANVRMSYWVVIFFVYRLFQIMSQNAHRNNATGEAVLWEACRAIGDEAILLITVLCHEFGHGNMCRWLGGKIDHILLWVFGGICFTHHPSRTSKRLILRDDLLIVAAGPFTHCLQVPAWGVLLAALFSAGLSTGYATMWDAFVAAAHPLENFNVYHVQNHSGLWAALPWALVGDAISLNVWLFLFNVFFPMYPMDSVKLLVVGLMFCFGATPRCAATVLLCVSVPCALYFVLTGILGIVGMHTAGPPLMQGLMMWLGIMSLIECHKIWQLYTKKQLHQHPLFQTARSFSSQQRDSQGRVTRINVSDFDDNEPITEGCGLCDADVCGAVCCCSPCCGGEEDGGVCCFSACFPCAGSRKEEDFNSYAATRGYGSAESAETARARSDRNNFLARLEQQTMQNKRPVKEVLDEQASGPSSPPPAAQNWGSGRVGSSSTA